MGTILSLCVRLWKGMWTIWASFKMYQLPTSYYGNWLWRINHHPVDEHTVIIEQEYNVKKQQKNQRTSIAFCDQMVWEKKKEVMLFFILFFLSNGVNETGLMTVNRPRPEVQHKGSLVVKWQKLQVIREEMGNL